MLYGDQQQINVHAHLEETVISLFSEVYTFILSSYFFIERHTM